MYALYLHPQPTFARVEKITVSIINHSPHPLPAYQTSEAAGMDLAAWIEAGSLTLQPLERMLIRTGLHIQLPRGFEAQIRPRSGTAFKKGLTVVNAPGTIDSDYTGEIRLAMINLSSEPLTVADGERIAQMVVARHEHIQWQPCAALHETERSSGGFGSTGK